MINKKLSLIVLASIIVLIFLFYSQNTSEQKNSSENSSLNSIILETNLKDIRTGKSFSINEFKGKPILVESFAVWCPTCTQQQKEIKKLHSDLGDKVISISLDTDPNENTAGIKNHIEKNNFNWYYAISPVELTTKLIEQFGNDIVNAPQAPMILICKDQTFKKLPRGIKTAEKLKEELKKECV